MNFFYIIKDKQDKTIFSDGCKGIFLSESDFREYIKNDMKEHFATAHYCEYYQLGVSRAKVKTIANF